MPGVKANGLVPSAPLPLPKSPPEYPDLYGKRSELAKVQVLEREIGFLEEELKSVECLQPASRPCKEVVDSMMCCEDPFTPLNTKVCRSCRFWKWLWICCCSCSATRCCECSKCSYRNRFGSCQDGRCLNMSSCSWDCCLPKCPSCLTGIRCRCYPKCVP